jgi:hypothetical protein
MMTNDARAAKYDDTMFDLDVRPKTPEERLMVAVLEEAVITFERGLRSSDPMIRQESYEVDSWVRSSCSDALFSFENVCSILGIDAEYLRAGFASMRRNARNGFHSEMVRKPRATRPELRRGWKGRIG